jgi:hypothetical protein
LVALSEPISFPYIFFHFKKVVSRRAHAALSLSLAHAHKQRLRVKMRRWYTAALLFAHSSELFVRTKKERERKEHRSF